MTVPTVVPDPVMNPIPVGPNIGAGLNTIPGSENQTTTALPWLSNFFVSLGTFTQNLFVTSPNAYADRVMPSLATIRMDASTRWPFAAGTLIGAISPADFGGSGGDGMEWFVDVTPTQLSPSIHSGSVGVWIRPLTWLDPFKPYRWVFRSAIAISLILALFLLLRPKVHV